jgi:cation:H+ antiporter
MTILLFVVGLVALIGGAEIFLKGVDRFGLKWGISPIVMGLTVVAFATGAPELAISIQAATTGSADLVLGNIIGSNIANILLILGFAALVGRLNITRRIIRIDVPIVIGVSLLLFFLALDGGLSGTDGMILMGGLVAYSVFTFIQIRREDADEKMLEVFETDTTADELADGAWFYIKNLGLLAIGLALIVKGSDLMVDSAVTLARVLGISELVIGLTIVSIGTSLPEVATSVAAVRRNNSDLAVANVMGSNLYNILLTLGLTLIIAPGVLQVSEAALYLDLPFMVAVSIACIPIFLAGLDLTKTDGAIFLFYYVTYLTYLVMDAMGSTLTADLKFAMLWFVIPATIIYMFVRLRERNRWSEIRSK